MPIQHFAVPTVSAVREFDDWIRRHEHDGFFVSVRSPGLATLHRASCTHGEASRMTDELGGIQKICSSDRFALTDWVRENRINLKRCDCI